MALGSVAKVAEQAIAADTDCFGRANLADVMTFALKLPASGTTFTGEFYAKGSIERTIKTHFPIRLTEQQVVYSRLALFQYAINVDGDDAETLEVLTTTARNFVALYEAGMGVGLQSVVQIATLAYMHAIEVART